MRWRLGQLLGRTTWATDLQGAGLTVLAKNTQQKATLQHDLFETYLAQYEIAFVGAKRNS